MKKRDKKERELHKNLNLVKIETLNNIQDDFRRKGINELIKLIRSNINSKWERHVHAYEERERIGHTAMNGILFWLKVLTFLVTLIVIRIYL